MRNCHFFRSRKRQSKIGRSRGRCELSSLRVLDEAFVLSHLDQCASLARFLELNEAFRLIHGAVLLSLMAARQETIFVLTSLRAFGAKSEDKDWRFMKSTDRADKVLMGLQQ